jgi:hypothetical protein
MDRAMQVTRLPHGRRAQHDGTGATKNGVQYYCQGACMWDIAPRWGSDLLITGPNVHAIELGSRGWFVKR